MLIKRYPAPCRVDNVPSPYEPDEDGVMDVGYKTGSLSDGRSYRLECWRMDEMLMLTIMFADKALEGYCRADMPLLLEGEGLLEFKVDKPRLQAARTKDDAGNSMWAVNLMLANGKGTYAELLVPLNRYRL